MAVSVDGNWTPSGHASIRLVLLGKEREDSRRSATTALLCATPGSLLT